MSVHLYNTAATDACGGCLKAIQQDIIKTGAHLLFKGDFAQMPASKIENNSSAY